MLYQTTCAILLKGDRIPAGTEIDLDPAFAAGLGTDVVPVGETTTEAPTPEPEKPVSDMTVAELREKAATLGLATGGSKADLVERITLHIEGTDAA